MKTFAILSIFTLIVSPSFCQTIVDYIQPLSGTAASTTKASLKHGGGTELNANTIPSVTVPFAMTQWTPQTRTTETKCVPPYFYKDSLFSGFRGTHWLSGSCVQDYGSVTIMPITGSIKTSGYATRFSHSQEISTPYVYTVTLPEYDIKASVTATSRCGLMEFTCEKDDSVYILITPNSDYAGAYLKIDNDNGEIYGYNPVHRIYQGWGKSAGFSGHFVIAFEKAFGIKGTFANKTRFTSDSIKNIQGLGAYVGFKMKKGEKLHVRIGTSFSSLEGARKNLQTEIPGYDFKTVMDQCKNAWQQALEKIKVTGPNEKDKRIFYTALYHALQHPRLYNDVDGTYPAFSSENTLAKMEKGNYYDDFSMWDIYRAQLPLLEILYPSVINDIVQSLILKGEQGGWMPIFPCWNSYTAAMIGDHTAPVIASAYLKGIRNYDAKKAYLLLRQNAFSLPQNQQDYIDGKGRRGLTSYLKYGYIPLEDTIPYAFHKKEQVSRTLEYAYDDYALAQMAKSTGNLKDYDTLIKRAGNYKNVFDPSAGLVRGRYADGSFIEKYNPDMKEPFITEGTPRQYTFYVPQDVNGLAQLMGGTHKLEEALDTLFAKNEYWHGNEPGHQIPFLYNYTSSPWKTQLQVQNIMAEEYSDGPGGLSGNDDSGQMSAWFVFAAMGFYPVDPVSGVYQLSTPLFNTVSIAVNENRHLNITKSGALNKPATIASATLNGAKLPHLNINYSSVINGGSLLFNVKSFSPLKSK